MIEQTPWYRNVPNGWVWSLSKDPFTYIISKANGISPLISNPTRQFMIGDPEKKEDFPPAAAMLWSTKTKLHNHGANDVSEKDAMIAFPNDRAASIRTIFTKMPRYDYLDPDFEYTDLEKLEKKIHRDYYKDYIRNLRNIRLQKEEQRKCYAECIHLFFFCLYPVLVVKY
ncbi:hypothetical protein STEG23_006617 [Scotinomys teguina]